MKLTIEIESDHESLLGPNDGVSRVLRDIATEFDRIGLFTMNDFTVTLYDKYGDEIVGQMTQTKENYNPGNVHYKTNEDGTVVRFINNTSGV